MNILFTIEDDGVMRWYRYQGKGQPNSASGNADWDPNSGNPIGHGWGDFSQIVVAGNAVMVGIRDNGDMYWYKYTGQGESDISGRLGWAPESGTKIGEGWQQFEHVLSWGGNAQHDIALMAVGSDALIRWYDYSLNAEYGRIQGWQPNSGNLVGHGWNFQRLIGASNSGVLFAVTDAGDLRWYRYSGRGEVQSGEYDPLGLRGWEPNSGNTIGHGWSGFSHLSVSLTTLTDFPGSSSEMAWAFYGVEPSGNLRWYRYTGQGEHDPSGTIGWHPNSRNVISSGW